MNLKFKGRHDDVITYGYNNIGRRRTDLLQRSPGLYLLRVKIWQRYFSCNTEQLVAYYTVENCS